MRDKDPEQLLSEALRAQAVQAGPPATPGFGLLSGNDLGMAARVQAMVEDRAPAEEPVKRLNGGLVLLVAVALGLACGAVAGLLTVL